MATKSQTDRADQRRAETSELLVRAAASVFAERGYHATRVSDIAERAGVGQGTFYRHFDDKRAVVDSVVTATMQRLHSAFEEQNAPNRIATLAEYRERAVDIANTVFDLIAAEHAGIGFMWRELPSIDAEAVKAVAGLRAMMSMVIEEYYVTGIRRGYFRPDLDTASATTVVLGMGLSAAWTILSNPDDTEFRRRYSRTVVEFIVRHASRD